MTKHYQLHLLISN